MLLECYYPFTLDTVNNHYDYHARLPWILNNDKLVVNSGILMSHCIWQAYTRPQRKYYVSD